MKRKIWYNFFDVNVTWGAIHISHRGGIKVKKAVFLTTAVLFVFVFLLTACTPPNKLPTWTKAVYTVAATVSEQLVFNLADKVSDEDDNTLTIEIVDDARGAKIEDMKFKWTPTSSGTFEFTLKAKDSKGGEATAGLVVVVGEKPNKAPVWNLPTDAVQVQKGQLLQYNLADKVSDPDGDEVTIAVVGGPSGYELVGNVLKWNTTAFSENLYEFVLKATDARGASAFGVLKVSITPAPVTNNPPRVLPVPDKIVKVGEQIVIELSNYVSDPDGDALTLTLKSGPGYLIGTKYYWFPKNKLSTLTTVSIDVTDSKGATKTLSFKVSAPYDGNSNLTIYVTDYKSGSATQGATIQLKQGNTVVTQQTDASGKVVFTNIVLSSSTDFDVVISKNGYAKTYIEGIRLQHNQTTKFETQLRIARLGPTTNDKPFELELEMYDSSGNPLMPDSNVITNSINVLGAATSTEYTFNLWYVKVGGVPGAGTFAAPRAIGYGGQIMTSQSVREFEGMTPVFIDVYDQNDNRYEKIVYLTVIRTPSVIVSPYVVQKYTAAVPSSYNIIAYTRAQGIEYYKKGTNPTAAPKGTNLYIEVRWRPWYSASGTSAPKAYKVYRSFDGVSFEPIATLPSTSYFYRDYSAELEPDRKVWYAVSSVYDGYEGPYTIIGDVIPLRLVDVTYNGPVNGSTNVSRNPTFSWTFSEITSPEGSISYLYDIWLYDVVVNDYGYYSLGYVSGGSAYYGTFASTTRTINIKFSDYAYGKVTNTYWVDFAAAAPYPYDKLQANKVYEWGNELLAARVIDAADTSIAYSIRVDDANKIGAGAIPSEIYHRFVTGTN